MRIISKFSDYYDCIMKTGMDKTIVYNRKEESFSFNENVKNYSSLFMKEGDIDLYSKDHPEGNTEYKYIIGFCGEIYPVVEFEKIEKNKKETISTHKIIHSNEDYLKFEDELYGKNKDRTFRRFFYSWEKSFFQVNYDFLKKYFIEYKTPIFVIRKEEGSYDVELVINCSLKEYEFYKIKDTYTAFQDIQMYISGVLGVGQPELIQIGNEDMIKKKGFDKWSFRKMAEGKK